MISILLATHNGEKYISKSIDSVLNQSYKDFEILVGFNGTIDKSKDIVNNYNDDRIKTFDYGYDKGKSKTLNKLLKEAKYDWVAIQDDDDIWIENKLEKQLQYVSEYDVVGSLIDYINENDDFIRHLNLRLNDYEIKFLSLNGDNQIANTSAIFKKSIALEINGWREDIDGIEDFDFWLRLMRNGKKFINIPEYLVKHRIHNNSNFNTKQYDIKKIL